jgi:uncharacterized protein YcaQ
MLAGRSLGVATVVDLADYYRLTVPMARPRVRELVDAGRLLPVAVQGWTQPAFLHPDVRLPRRVPATALLSPFDSLLWERGRVERLFGFRYRIEIYTPGPKRIFGYYVLPFLMDGALVARVDLKADRPARVLRVQASFVEPTHDADAVAERLGPELEAMAAWLDLDDVAVVRRGDLASALAARLRRLTHE